MKNRLKKILAFVLAFTMVFTSVVPASYAKELETITGDISGSQTLERTMEVGDTVTITGRSAYDIFTLNNTGVVTMEDNKASDRKIVVTAVAPGTATITHNYGKHLLSDEYYYKSTYTFSVLPTLTVPDNQQLLKGDTLDLSTLVQVASGTVVSYKSSNSSVVSVNGSVITGKGVGTATIEVTAEAGGKTNTKTFTVTVSVGVKAAATSLYEGQTVDYAAVSYPAGYTISYAVDDSGVISYENGKLTALKQGTGKLTASISEGGKTYTDTADITVLSNVKSFTVSPADVTAYLGCEVGFDFALEYYDANAKTDYSISWEIVEGTDNLAGKAGASANQVLFTGKNLGSSKLKLTAGGFSQTVTVTVEDVSFRFPGESVSVIVGGEKKLVRPYSIPAELPSEAEVTYTMEDPTIASISADGYVTGLKTGETTLYAIVKFNGNTYGASSYEDQKIKTKIYVNSNVDHVEYYQNPGSGQEISDVLLYEGTESVFSAIVFKKEALSTNHKISFYSSEPTVVSVTDVEDSNSATVTALKRGQADVYAEAEGQKAVAHVSVISNIKEVKLPGSLSINKGTSYELAKSLVEYFDTDGRRLSTEQQYNGYSVSFVSSAPGIATVNASTGHLEAKAAGTATVTVTIDSAVYYCVVTVKETFDSIAFDDEDSIITLDLSEKNGAKEMDLKSIVNVTYNDGSATQTKPLSEYPGEISLEWSAANDKVASVDTDGNVTAKAVGYTTVTLKADSSYINITVRVIDDEEKPEYDDNITHRITVLYVFGEDCGEISGDSAASSWTGTYKQGQSINLSIKSPTVVGYVPDVATVTESIPAITGDIIRTVTYHPGPVNYTVKYFLETANAGVYEQYNPTHTYTFVGMTGEKVGLHTVEFDTMSSLDAFKSYNKQFYDREQKIAADGSTIVEIRYSRKYYTIRFDLDGGLGIDPIYGRFGTTVSVRTPTKAGYQFAGWYSDPECTKAVSLSNVTIPEGNVTYYAAWSPKTDTTYTVIHWLEDANTTTYSVATNNGTAVIETLSGTTGASTNAQAKSTNAAPFKNYTVSQNDIKQETIAGDGSTIVNVYYSRNVYSIYFKNGSKTLTDLTITAKWGQVISDKWPTNSTAGNRWATSNGGSTYQCNINVMPVGGDTFYVPGDSGSYSMTAKYYLEVLAGASYPAGTTTTRKDNGVTRTYYLDHTDTTTSYSSLSVTSEDKYEIYGYTYIGGTGNGYDYNNAAFYYTRNTYSITYYNNDGTNASKVIQNIQYQTNLNAATYKNQKPADRAGYNFVGWYTDETCQNAFNFNTTMPDRNLLLFAKWEPKKVVLTVISENITNDSHSVLFEGLAGFVPANHKDFNAATVASWEAVNLNPSDTREFIGWFKDTENGPVPFSFESSQIYENTTVRAMFRSDRVAEVRIHYVGVDGSSQKTLADDSDGFCLEGEALTYTAKRITQTDGDGKKWYPRTNSHSLYLNPDPVLRNDPDVTYTEDTLAGTYLYEYTFYYEKKASVKYTVRCVEEDDPTKVLQENTYDTSDNAIVVYPPSIANMTPVQRVQSFILSADNDQNIITFTYRKCDNNKAPVTVLYYLAIQGTNPVQYDELKPYKAIYDEVTIGTVYNYVIENIPGYNFKEASVAQGTTVTGEGLFIILYYNCNEDCSYTVEYKDYTTKQSIYQTKTVTDQTYGSIINETALPLEGYTVVGASSQQKTLGSEASSNVFTFYYSEVTANISYESVTTGSTVSRANESLSAVSGTALGSVANSRDGYSFVGWFSDPTCKADSLLTTDATFRPSKKTGTYMNYYESATYYAKWELCTYDYTVHYYLNGTTYKVAQDLESSASAFTEISPAEITGYEVVDATSQGVDSDGAVITFYYRKTITLVANSGTFKFDGSSKTVKGFTIKEGEIDGYGANFTTSGIVAERTESAVGTYDVEFTNPNDVKGKVDATGYYKVVALETGKLSITTNDTAITVYITGDKKSYTYDGVSHSASGFAVDSAKTTPANTGFTEKMVGFVSAGTVTDPSVTKTDAGTYSMGLTEANFTSTSENYTNVSFVVTDGELTIDPRPVTIVSGSGEWEYDGTAHVNQTITEKEPSTAGAAEGFLAGHGVDPTFYASSAVTHVVTGEKDYVENRFTYTAKTGTGTNLSNYDITVEYGKLKITPITAAITVKISGKSATEQWDGDEHSVSGYTFEAVAAAEANAAKAALYTIECIGMVQGAEALAKGTDVGSYNMNLQAASFENVSADFTNITFVIAKDGVLTIESEPIIIDDLNVSVVDGKPQEEGNDFVVTASLEEALDEDGEIEVAVDGVTLKDHLVIKAGELSGSLTVANPNTEDVYVDPSTVVLEFTGLKGTTKSIVVPDALRVKEIAVADTIQKTKVTLAAKNKFITAEDDAVFTVSLSNAPATGSDAKVKVQVGALNYYPVVKAGTTSVEFTVTKPFDGVTNGVLEAEVISIEGGRFEATDIGDSDAVTETTVMLDVIVTIAGNKATKEYNGTEQSVEGYSVVSINNSAYTESDFAMKEASTAKASGIHATVTPIAMGLTANDFENKNDDFAGHVTFVVTDGSLTITKRKVTGMTITAGSASREFDGTALTCSDFEVTEGVLLDGDTMTVVNNGSQTAVGSSANQVDSYKITRMISQKEVDVTSDYGSFSTAEGLLTVTPVSSEIEILIVGASQTETYDGDEYEVDGYEVTIPEAYKNILHKSDVQFTGTAHAEGTDAGTYSMGLKSSMFSITNTSFTNVKFTVTDGVLTINKRDASLTSPTSSKKYDGTALTATTVIASGFIANEGVASYNVTGSQTIVGSSANTFTYTLKSNTKESNYNITKNEGTLTVDVNDNKITVTVTGNTDEVYYNGKEQSVTGYTLEADKSFYLEEYVDFLGEDDDKTASGIYAGTYNMGLTSELFENNSSYFSNVVFEVEDGSLKINKRQGPDGPPEEGVDLTITSGSDSKVYDGDALTKDTFEVTEGILVDGDVLTVNLTGTQTNAGSSKNSFASQNPYKIMRGEVEVTDSYGDFTLVAGTLEVTKKPVKITVSNFTKVYGEDDPEDLSTGYTLTDKNGGTNPLINANDLGTITVVRDDPAGTDSEATGEHKLTANYTANQNYEVTVVTGKLTITKDGGMTVTITDDTEGKPVALGQKIKYHVVVENTGNVTLTIDVEDVLTGLTKTVTLAPGEKQAYDTDEYTVTEADIIKGTVTNTANATAEDPEGDDVTPASDFVEDSTVEIDNTLQVTKTATYPEGKTSLALKDKVTYTITVENIGNVTVKDIVVTDELLGYTSVAFDLAPGANKTLPTSGTLSYTVTEEDLLATKIDNIAVAKGQSPIQGEEGTDEVTYQGSATVNTDAATGALTVTKKSNLANNSTASLNQVLSYTFVIENTGNIAVNDITITDPLTGFIDEIESLAPGAKKTYTNVTTYTVTKDDIVAGKVENTVTVTGTGADGKEVKAETTNTVTTDDVDNTITLEKTCSKTSGLEEDDELTYYFEVENIGNVTVSGIVVTDERIDFVSEAFTLEPGDKKTVSSTYVVKEEDIADGEIVNTAAAAGKDPLGADTDAKDTCTVTTETIDRSLELTKTITNFAADYKVKPGDVIEYQITVKNTGNLTAKNVVVVDSKLNYSTTVTEIAVGDTWTSETLTYTVKEADLRSDDKKVVNAAGASGTSSDGEPTESAGDTAEIGTVDPDRTLKVEKISDVTGTASLGQQIQYQITVTNIGNQTAYDIAVEDELTGDSFEIDELAPGAYKTFTTKKYTVTEDDILAGSVLNTATALGEDFDGNPTTGDPGTEETPLDEAKGVLTVAKTSDVPTGNTVTSGDEIIYSFVVKNTGNITVTGIELKDEKIGYFPDAFDLAPNESKNLTAPAYTVIDADVIAGVVKNTAVAAGTDKKENEIKGEGTSEIPTSDANRNLTVVKTSDADGTKAELGQEINYTITIKNEGNLTANDVLFVDELLGLEETITSIEPGDTVTRYGSYIVQESDLEAGQVVNVATAQGTTSDGEPTTGGYGENTVETVDQTYTLLMEKSSDVTESETVALNQTIKYTLKVTNTSNQTISNILVTDSLTGLSTNIGSLAPGAIYELKDTPETQYTVTEADIRRGYVENTAKAEGTGPNGSTTQGGEDTLTLTTEEKDRTLTVTKTADKTEGVVPGEVVTFTITVKNAGNLTAKDIVVTDELLNNFTCDPFDLAPGDSKVINNLAYTVTEADIRRGTIVNVATAQGTDEDEEPTEKGEGQITVTTVEPDRTLTVTKEADKTGPVDLDEVITYTITVKNDGNQTAYDVVVEDPLTNDTWTITELAPGTDNVKRVSYTVTEADLIAGKVVNTVTAKGEDEDGNETPEGNDTKEIPTVEIEGQLTVEKTTDKGEGVTVNAGETITYYLTVTNNTNATVREIVIKDEKLNYESEESFSLISGQSHTETVTYLVTEQDLINGSVVNSAVATGKTPDETPIEGGGENETPTSAINRNLTVVKESDVPEGDKAILGQTINYTIYVTNAGNMAANDILVIDEKTGLQRTITTLAPGVTETITTSYVVTEEDVAAGSVINVVTASGTTTDGEPTTGGQGTNEVPTEDANRTLSVVKESSLAEGEKAALGQVITYKITVTNTGNLTAKNVEVADALTGESWTIDELAPEGEESFETSYTVTEEDILAGYVLNTATAKGTSSDDEPIEGGGESNDPTEDKNRTLTVVKDSDKTEGVLAGEVVTYTITVTNSGNLTASDITVTDDLTNASWTITELAPGASETFETTYTVTADDVLNGVVLNTVTAKGTSSDDEPTEGGEGEKEIHPVDEDRKLTVTKESDVAEGEKAALGQTITYTITVENTGNIDAYNVTVTDEMTQMSELIEYLAVGDTKTFSTTYIVTEADVRNGQIVNRVLASGTDKNNDSPIGGEGENTVSTEEKNSHLEVTKVSDATGEATLGQVINYTITVLNDGNQTINNVVVSDALTGETWNIESITPGTKLTYTTSYTVTEEDIRNGSVVNTATAKGTDDDGEENGVGEGSDETTTEEKKSELTLTKISDFDGKTAELGQTITYTITVKNVGNQTAYNVAVTDAKTGLSETIDALEPGATKIFTTYYTVKQSDILAGSIVNNATAKGQDGDGEETEGGEGGNEITAGEKNSHLTLTKTADVGNGEVVSAGRVITYTIRVVNDGNVTISDIVVEDKLTGLRKTGITLAPGQEVTYTTTYTVTEADVKAGNIHNAATASGTDPENEENGGGEGSNDVPTGNGSAYLTVTKVSDKLAGEKVELGDKIKYTITVKNTGNLTAQNITVQDDKTGNEWNIASLGAGSSRTFEATYTVAEEDIIDGKVLNHVTARGKDINGDDTKGGDASNEVLTEDLDNTIQMVKTANVKDGEQVKAGDVIKYALTVTNLGNVTVTDIVVKDELTGLKEEVLSLKPGKTATFMTNYTVTDADADKGRVLNHAVVSGTAPDGEPTQGNPGTEVVESDDQVEILVSNEEPSRENPTEEPSTEEPSTEEPETEEPSTQDSGNEPQEIDPETEELNADGTPRARGNGYWALFNLILTALTAMIAFMLLIVMKRRQNKADDDAFTEEEKWIAEDEELERNRKLWRYFAVFISSAAIVIFIITEDVTQTMRMTDKYTVLMAVIAVFQLLVAVLARKKKESKEELKDEEVMA